MSLWGSYLLCASEILVAMAVIQDDLPCLDNDAIEHLETKTKVVSPERLLWAIVEICSAVDSGVAAGQMLDISSEEKEVTLRLAYQVWDDIIDATGSTVLEMGKKTGMDLVRDKATYPELMGIDAAKNYARELVAEANKEPAYVDSSKAAPLYHMANFIVSQPY
ncbi:Geranylgeranyl pyrophosphate synthase [Melia azedarach]|uniref:Geranylgeranyl pyrophosphate synthase n=1 Tax=Melia azedarach TaxID=155640 RepID=A0ACC1X679_MELAZ|nr:Geranylgeranyl pyrophosphate synthase [Melia azedarach]